MSVSSKTAGERATRRSRRSTPRSIIAEPGVEVVVGGDVLQVAGQGVEAEETIGTRLVEPYPANLAEPPAGCWRRLQAAGTDDSGHGSDSNTGPRARRATPRGPTARPLVSCAGGRAAATASQAGESARRQ